jgi:hypothetical protein
MDCGSLLPLFAPCFESGKGGGKPPHSKAAPFEGGMPFSLLGMESRHMIEPGNAPRNGCRKISDLNLDQIKMRPRLDG